MIEAIHEPLVSLNELTEIELCIMHCYGHFSRVTSLCGDYADPMIGRSERFEEQRLVGSDPGIIRDWSCVNVLLFVLQRPSDYQDRDLAETLYCFEQAGHPSS